MEIYLQKQMNLTYDSIPLLGLILQLKDLRVDQ